MDNPTHSLLGLMLSRAGLNRLTPFATVIAIVSANLPDIDLCWSLSNSAVYLDRHRAYTHSVLLSPLLALVPVLVTALFTRKLKWGWAYLISWIAVLSHLFLDWTNTYGTRLLLPISEQRFRLDWNNVYDYWFWTVLLLAWLSPMLAGLVGGEIGAKKTTAGRGWPIFALTVLSFYEGGRYLFHQRAVTLIDSRLYDGSAPRRAAAVPHAGNPFLWDGIVETSTAYGRQTIDVRHEFDPLSTKLFAKPDPSPVMEAAKSSAIIAAFLRFSAFPLWRTVPVDEPKGGTLSEVCDLRFGDPQDHRFCAQVTLDSSLRPVQSDFRF